MGRNRLWLFVAFPTGRSVFEAQPCGSVYQYFLSFYGRVTFQVLERSDHALCIHRSYTCRLFPRFGCCEQCCLENSRTFLWAFRFRVAELLGYTVIL